MANKEIYRIGIKIDVDGAEETKKKLSAMEKYTQQTENRMKALNKINASPTAKIKDSASSAIDKINSRTNSLNRAVISPTARLNDQATSRLNSISTTIRRLDNANVTATLRINDQASTYIDRVHARINTLSNTNINPTAELSDRVPSHSDTQHEIMNSAGGERVHARTNTLENTNVNTTAELSDQSSTHSNSQHEMMNPDGGFRTANVSATESADTINDNVENINNVVNTNLTAAGTKISDVGDKISAVGGKLTKGVTLPIVGIGIATAKVGMDFDSAMSRVKAISGATGDDFENLKKQAIDLGGSTAFSAKEAASGMENLASAGFTTQQIMTAMPGMLDLAASSGEDLASSSDIAASTLNGFGLAADQAGHVADVLAKNASATNAAVKDTGEAMKYVAPVAQTAGWSLESVTASIGEMANAGIKGSQAGTTLRSAVTSLAKPSDEAAKAMQAMGFNAYDSHHKMKPLKELIGDLEKSTSKMTDEQKQNTIATVFGQESMSGILTLIKAGPDALDTLTKSYENSDGAAKKMATTMQDNAKSAIEQMTGSMETAAIKVEESFAPKITELANYIGNLADKFAALSPEQQDFYAKLLIGAAVLGPVTRGIGALVSGIGGLVGIAGNVASIFTGAAAAETTLGGEAVAATGLLGGLGTVVGVTLAAVALLGVGIAGVVTHNELMSKSVFTSSDKLNGWEKVINSLTGSTIKSKKELQDAGVAYEDFSSDLSTNFKSSVEDASKSFNKLKMTLAFDGVKGDKFTDSMSQEIKDQVDGIVNNAKQAVMSKRGDMQDTLSQLFTLGDDTLDANETGVMSSVADYQDSKFNTIQTLNQNIYDTLNTAVEKHKQLTEEDIANIKSWTQQVQALQIDSSTENEADSQYSSNQSKFEKRLSSMTPEEALSSVKDAYNQIIDIDQDSEDKSKKIISKATSLKTELNKAYNEAIAKGETTQADKLKDSIKTIDEKVTAAQDVLNSSIIKRQQKNADLWEAFYKANETMRGKVNEVNFSEFSTKDIDSQKDLNTLEYNVKGVADATESGMKRIKDSNGYWHDVQVTVDEVTGHIISAYDTTTGKFGGYSKEFADKSEEMYKSAYESQDKIKTLMSTSNAYNSKGANFKLDEGNNFNYTSSDGITENLQKMDKVVELSGGYKAAVANINGTQIKMEFNKDGILKNYDDVISAINGDKNSKAVVNIDVSNAEVMAEFKETEDALNKIPPEKKIELTTNAPQATSDINKTKSAIDSLHDKNIMINTTSQNLIEKIFGGNDNSSSASNKGSITSDMIPQKPVVKKFHEDGTFYASGTNNAEKGVATVAEKGYEVVFGRQKRMFNGGEKVLDHDKSKEFLENQPNNEPFQVKQGQYQLVQPQLQVAGTGGVSIGDIQVNVSGNQDSDGIVKEVVQVVGYKLKEALTNTKK